MSASTQHIRIGSPLHCRLRRYGVKAASVLFGIVIALWSIAPIYNRWVIALDSHDGIFAANLWPEHPSLDSFRVVVTQDFWCLERFWQQFGNTCFVAFMTTFLTLFIGSLASFTVGRLHLRNGWLLTNAALTTFATPYAIFIFSQYGKSIPMELDESARIDGANSPQIYFRIYLPLMALALVAVGTYAMLLIWNEYLYNFPLLSTPGSMTVAVALAPFLNSDESPWNFIMATAILCALPPIILYYGFRRNMVAGLAMGGVKR